MKITITRENIPYKRTAARNDSNQLRANVLHTTMVGIAFLAQIKGSHKNITSSTLRLKTIWDKRA